MEVDETEYVEDGDEVAVELCCCCVKPVAPGANFCGGCGAPLNFFATTLPYQRILAEGFFLRRAISEPRSMLTVAGVWVFFSGYLAMGGIAVAERWWEQHPTARLEDFAEWLMMAGYAFGAAGIGIAALLQVTWNYVRYVRERKVEGGE